MSALPTAILCGLFFGTLGALCATWAMLCVARGDYLTAVVAIGFAMFCVGFVVPFAKVVPGRVRARVEFDAHGSTFRPDRGIDVPIALSLLGLGIGGGLFAIFQPIGKLDVPVPDGMRLYLPFVAAAAAFAALPIVGRTLHRGSSKYLRLNRVGFELAQGWAVRRAEWGDVQEVTDERPGQSAPTPGAVVVVLSDGTVAAIAAGAITPGGQALRELVRFYWQHSDRRGELTDGRASKRLAGFDIGS